MAKDASLLTEQVLQSGWIGEGPKVSEFENNIKEILGAENVCALNSGTSALELAIDLAGLKRGDEIISTPMTCAATNIPVVRRGINIKWADINPETGNIDVESIASCLDKKTKALIIMDWGGTPCDLDAINALAGEAGIPVIEDAAHAFGSQYKDKAVGRHSDFVCFSFQAIKTITTGDGGALVCQKSAHHDHAKLARWFGIDRAKRQGHKPWDIQIDIPGYKFHMNDIAASIGLANLPHLDKLLAISRANALDYNQRLGDIPQIRLTHVPSYGKSSYWLYTILCENRDALMAYLLEKKIGCGMAHSRNDQYDIFKNCFAGCELRGVSEFSKYHLNLPVGYWITAREVEYISDSIRDFYV